jgi:hypothetical protein
VWRLVSLRCLKWYAQGTRRWEAAAARLEAVCREKLYGVPMRWRSETEVQVSPGFIVYVFPWHPTTSTVLRVADDDVAVAALPLSPLPVPLVATTHRLAEG